MSADILQFPSKPDPRIKLLEHREKIIRDISKKTMECATLIQCLNEIDQEFPAEFAHNTRSLLNVLAQGYAEFAVWKAEQQERTG
jgi:hypothetical protein